MFLYSDLLYLTIMNFSISIIYYYNSQHVLKQIINMCQFKILLQYYTYKQSIKLIIILQIIAMQGQASAKVKTSQQQLRQRRRQKILARMNAQKHTQQQQRKDQTQPQPHKQSQAQQKPKQGEKATTMPQISAFQMFEASKRHDKFKMRLQATSIILGILSAIINLSFDIGETLFVMLFFLITISSAYLYIERTKKVSKFTNQNTVTDQLLLKVTNIKQLDIVNKILDIKSSVGAVAKLLASYFLTVVAYTNFSSTQI